jgi:gliding motility-associated lipoprotein GldH
MLTMMNSRKNNTKYTQFSILILITTLVVLSCSTYKEYDENSFPSIAWEAGQTITFNPNIEDMSKTYRLGFGMRHVYGLSNSSIKITVKAISPSGNATMASYDFMIKDPDGDYLGSCAGDTCDLEAFVSEDLKFNETGEYTFMLSHNSRKSISGIMALGLIIDEK